MAAWVQNITYPNGEIWSFGYEEGHYPPDIYNPEDPYAIRLASVTNNHGYMLRFEYVLDRAQYAYELGYFTILKGVQSLNRAVDECTAAQHNASTCSGLTRNWPRVSYASPYDTVQVATDEMGRATTYTYNGAGVTSVRSPGATVEDFTVVYGGPNGGVSSFTQAGSTWTYGYTNAGTQSFVVTTSPTNQGTLAASNPLIGRLTSFTSEVNTVTYFTYDSQGRMTGVSNHEGDSQTFTLDARGNTTSTVWAPKPGSGLSPITTSATYPADCASTPRVICNKPLTTTDGRGFTTDYTWNATHGGIETITLPAPTTGAARPQTRYTYAPQTLYVRSGGTLVPVSSGVTLPVEVSQCVTGASCDATTAEVVTTVQYGTPGVAHNLLPTVVSRGSGADPAMSTTTSTWTPNGDLATVDGPLAGTADTSRIIYDDARQLVGMIGPDPDGAGTRPNIAQRVTYDARGAVIRTELGTTAGQSDTAWANFAAQQKSETDHDAYGRPVVSRAMSAAGAIALVQQVSYDNELRVDCTATRMNPSVWTSLPASACTPQTPGADGPDRITQTTYDAADRPVSTTSALGQPEAITTRVTYTPNGQVASMTDGNGNVSVMEYDGFDRHSRLYYPNSIGGGTSATDYVGVTYDSVSNVVGYRNRAGQTTTVAYDALNRPTLVDAPSGTMDVAMSYDQLGRVLSRTGAGQTLSFTYDPLSRMTQESGPLGAVGYQYDLAGRVTQIASPGGYTATYDRDVIGNTLAVRSNGAASGPGVLASYAYDGLGRQTSLTRGNGVTSARSYDAFGRMTGLSHDLAGSANDVAFGFTYNPAGQIATRTVSNPAYGLTALPASTYTHDGLNRMTAVNGGALGYDANQNITTGLGTTYAYDAANRLTGAGSSTLSYDPADRLYRSTGDQRRFQYSGAQLIAEYDDADAMAWRYVSGQGLDNALAQYQGSGTGTAYWPITDERGTVIALTDGAGARSALNTYDEYGVPGSGNSGRMQYTGQMWLGSMGAYHYRARAYVPGIGRFLQTDPAGYNADQNLYNYVGSDPINLTDPTGFRSCTTGPNGPDNPGDLTCTGTGRSPLGPSGPGIFHRIGTAAGLPQNDSSAMFPEGDTVEDVIVTADNPPPGYASVTVTFWTITCGLRLCSVTFLVPIPSFMDPSRGQETPNGSPPADTAGTPDDPDDPNFNRQLSIVRTNREADAIAQRYGYDNAHQAKAGRGASRVNIYTDRQGRAYLWDGRRGSIANPL